MNLLVTVRRERKGGKDKGIVPVIAPHEDPLTVWDADDETPEIIDPETAPEHGDLTLNADAKGGFQYMPDSGYTGDDEFEYKATDGTDESNEATVTLEVVRPVPDIDTDFDGIQAGGSGGSGNHEEYEEESPGNVIRYNDDDDNENGKPDWEDSTPFEDLEGQPVNDGDLEGAEVNWETLGANLTGFKFTFGHSPQVTNPPPSLLKVWDTLDKQHELTDVVFTINASGDAVATVGDDEIELSPEDSVYVEGCATGEAELKWSLWNPEDLWQTAEGCHEINHDKVKFTVVRVDIDTDRNHDGTIDDDDDPPTDRTFETTAPGRILLWNADDDNENDQPDRDDPTPFKDLEEQPVNDDDLKPAKLYHDGVGAGMEGFTFSFETSPESIVKVWDTQDKQHELTDAVFTVEQDGVARATVGEDTIELPGTVYIEGYTVGQTDLTFQLKSPDPANAVVHSDTVKFTAVNAGLTAYRPQTEGPDYGNPFPRTAVPENKEENPGAGIRRNGDDDDDGGEGTPDWGETDVAGENDLIEVELKMNPAAPTGMKYVLKRSNDKIKVWRNSNKSGGAILDSEDQWEVTPATETMTVWVEWRHMFGSGADLSLTVWDTAQNKQALDGDRIHFYPFTSVVVASGGNDAQPLDANAGPFQMAIVLYEDGYDVHAYCEGIVDDAARIPYHEVERAVEDRGVTQVAVFGHSYGGGATYVLADQLSDDPPTGNWSLTFTGYIDAITHDWGWESEERLPLGTDYHVNYYQTSDEPDGEPTVVGDPPPDPLPDVINVHVTPTSWGANLTHTSIDNDQTVQNRMLYGHHISDGDPTHDGLTEKVSR